MGDLLIGSDLKTAQRLCFCGGLAGRIGASTKLMIFKCGKCKTLQATFFQRAQGESWNELHATKSFLASLQFRREEQAKHLVRAIKRAKFDQPILDYGCGQGVFVSTAVINGLAIIGVDLNPQLSDKNIFKLSKPWEIPQRTWRSVVLLDVLEHHESPVEFVQSIKANQLLLKVPSSSGPSAAVARVLFLFHFPRLLERLFLSDDPHPHYWLFSKEGVRSLGLKAGYPVVRTIRLAEFGRELASRSRIRQGQLLWQFFCIVGWANEFFGKYWSDTTVSIFLRAPTDEN